MLFQISTLILLGCFYPAVLSRPSVSLQNNGYGHYDFQYDVSHPKGSSRGHMKFGSAYSKRTGPHISDQTDRENHADYHAARSPLSSDHNPDSYRAEKVARRPQDYANSPHESEILHEPRPIYPSPYDSEEKQLGSHNGAHDEIYNPPVSKVNHQSPSYSASVPEADYNPHPPQPYGQEYNEEQHGHPNDFAGSSPVLSQEPISHAKVNHQSPSYSVSVPEADYNHRPPQPYGQEHIEEQHGHPNNFAGSSPVLSQEPISYAKVNHQSPSYSVSVPEADYNPHPPQPYGQEHIEEQHGHPNNFAGSNPVISQEPISQVSEPIFNEGYASNHEDSLNIQPVPVGPNYQFIPSGPPYVVDSHTTEIIHPRLPTDPIVVQQPVDLTPHSQEAVSYEPDVSLPPRTVDNQPALSHAFQLPVAPLPNHSPVLSGPNEAHIQLSSISDDSHLASLPGPVHPPPVSHSFRLPLLPIGSGHPPIPAGASVDAVNSVAHSEHSVDITPVDPISHSTRLLIPSHVPLGGSGVPKSLPDSLLGHESVNLGPQNEQVNGVSGLSEAYSAVTSDVPPPISHAFRLSLPQIVPSHPASSIPELKPIQGPSPFTEVESPEVPQLPQLSHAFRLNLPLNRPESSIPGLKPVGGPSFTSEAELPEEPQVPQLRHAFRLNLPLNRAASSILESTLVEGPSSTSNGFTSESSDESSDDSTSE